jgi:hypothetical protein
MNGESAEIIDLFNFKAELESSAIPWMIFEKKDLKAWFEIYKERNKVL